MRRPKILTVEQIQIAIEKDLSFMKKKCCKVPLLQEYIKMKNWNQEFRSKGYKSKQVTKSVLVEFVTDKLSSQNQEIHAERPKEEFVFVGNETCQELNDNMVKGSYNQDDLIKIATKYNRENIIPGGLFTLIANGTNKDVASTLKERYTSKVFFLLNFKFEIKANKGFHHNAILKEVQNPLPPLFPEIASMEFRNRNDISILEESSVVEDNESQLKKLFKKEKISIEVTTLCDKLVCTPEQAESAAAHIFPRYYNCLKTEFAWKAAFDEICRENSIAVGAICHGIRELIVLHKTDPIPQEIRRKRKAEPSSFERTEESSHIHKTPKKNKVSKIKLIPSLVNKTTKEVILHKSLPALKPELFTNFADQKEMKLPEFVFLLLVKCIEIVLEKHFLSEIMQEEGGTKKSSTLRNPELVKNWKRMENKTKRKRKKKTRK